MAYQEGQLLDGRYRILRPISLGGMATTYLAVDTSLQKEVTIEVFQSSPEDQASLRKIALLTRLDHPNILRALDYGKEANNLYLVSEYAPNGTLRQRHPKGSIVPLSTVISYTKQVASALQYAHDHGIVHRDVKPENMLLGRNNDVLLTDFGIATTISDEAQDIIGTPTFMAPEQFNGKAQPASDQYALAVVVYEWLTGKPPFSGSTMVVAMKHLHEPPPSLRANVPTIPSDVETVLLTALAKEPQKRFRSVRAFANALEQASDLRFLKNFNPIIAPQVSVFGSGGEPMPEDFTTQFFEVSSSAENTASATNALPPPPSPHPYVPVPDNDDDTMFSTPPSPQMPLQYSPPAVASGYLPEIDNPGLLRRASEGGEELTGTLVAVLSSFFIEAGNALASLFSGRGRKKQQETQLSLFAIARTTLGNDDRAIVGKVYTAQAGISQNRPENFRSEPFRVPVQNPTQPLVFDILLHPSENIELMEGWFQRLHYDPRNADPQFSSFPFRLKAPGRSYLIINFYRERQWLKTIRFEFDGIDQAVLANAIYRR